jgi:hypothetical protein
LIFLAFWNIVIGMKWEILHTGTFNGTEITSRWISDMVENFKGRVPVVLGHAKAFGGFFRGSDGAPADGWVDEISSGKNPDGQTSLYGQVELMGEAAEGFETKYRNWSAGVTQNDAGEFSLHHVALLGAVPPAIKGLTYELSESPVKRIQFSSGNGVHLMPKPDKKKVEQLSEETTEEVTDEIQEPEVTEEIEPEKAESEVNDEVTDEKVDEDEEPETITAELSDIRPNYDRDLLEENKRVKAQLAEAQRKLAEVAMSNFTEKALKAFPKAAVKKFSEKIQNMDPQIIKAFTEFVSSARPSVTLGEIEIDNKAPKRPPVPGMEA